jgi:hypothetical protein
MTFLVISGLISSLFIPVLFLIGAMMNRKSLSQDQQQQYPHSRIRR